MSRLFYHVMQDNLGNLLFDVSGTMRLAGTGTLATIYGDEAATVILPNPMTNHPSFGSFKCFLEPGSYDFYMAKAGYTFETLTSVQGLGTMSGQDSDAVAITGGAVNNCAMVTNQLAQFNAAPLSVAFPNRAGDNQIAIYSDFSLDPGSGRSFINHGGTAPSYFGGDLQITGRMAIGNTLVANPGSHLKIDFVRATFHGLTIKPSDSDTVGGASPVVFLNTGLGSVGSISTNATSTAYNTTSDSRLKHAIAPLTGALDVVQGLRPVRFRWKSTDEIADGFLGHELQQVVPNAVSGLPDAVNEDGSINPMQVDYSKLVPTLVAAVKELLARVATLEGAIR